MPLVYRLVKGSELTLAEGDGNISTLDGRITALETSLPEPVSIESITQPADDQLLITLTDLTTQGPFTLPSGRPNFQGEWEPSTLYAVNDWFTNSGSLYAVIYAHTSDSTFDPGANDGSGHDYYQLLLALTLPAAEVVEISDPTFAPTEQTDLNKYYRCTDDAGCTVTIPLDSSLPADVGAEFHFRQCGVGNVELVGESSSDGDVTLNSIDGYDTITGARGGVITAKKVAADEWDVWGLLQQSVSV